MANKTKSDKLVNPNDPILIKIAQAIPEDKINSPETKDIVDTLLNIAYGEQEDRKRPVLVGLAAPQAGISKRIILVDVKADGKGNVGDLRVYSIQKLLGALGKKTNGMKDVFLPIESVALYLVLAK